MTNRMGGTMSGLSIMVQYTGGVNPSFSKSFVKKQLGKYKLDEQYQFCYECLLDVMFGVNNDS